MFSPPCQCKCVVNTNLVNNKIETMNTAKVIHVSKSQYSILQEGDACKYTCILSPTKLPPHMAIIALVWSLIT